MDKLKGYIVWGSFKEYVLGYAFAENSDKAKTIALQGAGYNFGEHRKSLNAYRCKILEDHKDKFDIFVDVTEGDNAIKLCDINLSKYCKIEKDYIFSKTNIRKNKMKKKLTLLNIDQEVISDSDKFDFNGNLEIGIDDDGNFIGACNGGGYQLDKFTIGKFKIEKFINNKWKLIKIDENPLILDSKGFPFLPHAQNRLGYGDTFYVDFTKLLLELKYFMEGLKNV